VSSSSIARSPRLLGPVLSLIDVPVTNSSVKETVSRDFRPLVFFTNRLLLGPRLTP
jgi:hypothetical protein